MKNLFPFILVAACLTFSPSTRSHAAEIMQTERAKTAAEKLHDARFFALGGVGFAGITSEQELALRELSKDPNAESAFLALINDETTTKAGRLYALLGLKEAKSSQFEAQLPAFLADESPATQMSGCIRVTVTVGAIAQQIEKRAVPQKAATA